MIEDDHNGAKRTFTEDELPDQLNTLAAVFESGGFHVTTQGLKVWKPHLPGVRLTRMFLFLPKILVYRAQTIINYCSTAYHRLLRQYRQLSSEELLVPLN